MLKLFSENSRFRSYMVFEILSSIGGGIFAIFMIWAIHAQYQNPFYTGLAGFMFAVMTIANFLVGPFVDRHSKVTLLRVTCLVKFGVLSLVLVTSLTYLPGVWFLLLMIFIFSAATLVSNPATTAYLPQIVEGEDLLKANSLLNVVASIAGIGVFVVILLLVDGGLGAIYGISAGTMLMACIASVFLRSGVKSEVQAEKGSTKTYFAELKEGLLFAKRGALLFLIIAFVSQDLAASIAYVNVPMLVQVHTGEAFSYFVLLGVAILGSVLGSVVIGILGQKFNTWTILFVCFVLAGVSRIIFVSIIADDFTRSLFVHAFYICVGAAVGILFETLTQKLPPKRLVARISTIVASLMGLSSAFGALLGGIMGTLIPDIDMIFVIQGVSYIAIGFFLCLLKPIRELPNMNDVALTEDE